MLVLIPSGTAQLVAAVAVAVIFLATGLRVELRVEADSVLIRNPWSGSRIDCAEVEAITPQVVRDKTRSTNCLAIWQKGADEGWPVLATYRLSNPTDGFVRRYLIGDGHLDVNRWHRVGVAVGVPVSGAPANRAWRPGSLKRRRAVGSVVGGDPTPLDQDPR